MLLTEPVCWGTLTLNSSTASAENVSYKETWALAAKTKCMSIIATKTEILT